jgi:glycosyltransferase involved in cell wall biosynthesis
MTSKVKLLYVIGTLDVGGAEGQLVQLAMRLNRERFEPVVCCLSSSGPLARVLRDGGIPVEVIGFHGFRFFREPWKVVSRLFRLIRFTRKEQPLIVHGFLFWAYILGTYAAKLARVPVVIASRRSLGNFKEGNIRHLLIERVANRVTDVIVANSEAVKADVVRQERVEPSRVRVIYNGVDASRYESRVDPAYRAKLGIPDGGAIVSVVARLFDYKGHQFFLEACRDICRRWPTTTFLLIGDGPLRRTLEQMTRTLGLQRQVRFLGTRSDVPELLALTDVAVLPSLEEGFPNAILEAMAAAKPVVATLVGGIPEAVVHGETGLLVPPRDPSALAGAIGRLLDDPGLRTAMGLAGKQRIAERFTFARMVMEMEALYEERLNAAGYK